MTSNRCRAFFGFFLAGVLEEYMDKNTILAIVLSAIIITVGMVATTMVNESYAPPAPVVTESEALPVVSDTAPEEIATEEVATSTVSAPETATLPDQDYPVQTITEETDYFRVVFSTAGAVAKEIDLLQEYDGDQPVSMVLDGERGQGTFNLAFGGPETPYITDAFAHERRTEGNKVQHIFWRDYLANDQVFRLTKTYTLVPGEYMMELSVLLETPDGKAVPLLDGDQPAYTLTYGPQIGPSFEKIDGRYEIRENVTWGPDPKNGKFKREIHKYKGNLASTQNAVNWAAVVGKYFAVVVDPGLGNATITWDGNPVEGQNQPSRLQVSRPARRQSVIEDTYRFYIGPLSRSILSSYDNAEDNGFGVINMGLQNAPKTSSIWGWLQTILRWILEFFYKLVPNYGVAIILLTILVKGLLYPLTHKSYESTSKMQALQPKMKEIQAQYKDDPQKLNQKTAELYKSEGVNPMGGCLPMLLQFPIFIALYGLLNSYFPLRGAEFIPGWITDLSAPEFVWKEFANPINLLIINIPAIRLLPVLYLAGQLLMVKVTQQGAASGQTGAQQKMLTLGMPIMFFFILYNMPSGLLLYWTAMNFFTILQQLATNWLKKKKAAGGTA